MMLLSLALAQIASAPVRETIDLTIPQPCRAEQQSSGEVVVCANRKGESPYRLKQPVETRKEGLPKAEAQIAEGVTLSGETEGVDVGGFPSNRAMIRLKLKF
jgi:hypothetical protein